MTKYTSNKISNLSWICSILVVFIHATTWATNLPGQATSIVYGQNVSTFIQMFISEGIARIAVPLFFVFSGFLFFNNFEFTKACILTKWKKRIFSLLIPFLFWNIAVFLFFLIAQQIPAIAPYFSSRQIANMSAIEIIKSLTINSINSPLWYLWNLILLSILTPIIYILIKYAWWIFIPAVCVVGALDMGFITIRGSAICMFCIGSFIAIKRDMLQNILDKLTNIKTIFTIIFVVIWLGILVFKSLYLCSLPASVLLTGNYTLKLRILNKVNVVIGILAVWLLYDLFKAKINEKKFNLGKYGMMIFVMHHPIIAIIKKLFWSIFGGGMWASLIYYILSAIITMAIVIVFSILIKKILPKFYAIISGGR